MSDHIPACMWLSPDAEPVIYPASKNDRGQFANAAFLSADPVEAPETGPPAIGNRNLKIYYLQSSPTIRRPV
ncbi:MAG: hypothetical protein ABJL33_00845 [Hyphomicrobiales bacterium]